ncbi:MAG TPA: hypothetical protein DCR39_03555 [Nitrospiraceae bacterium]|nr:hypothetical protein [Nitrospiraceae bacterium]
MKNVFILLLTLSLSACGYQLAGRGGHIPDEIKSVAIPVFENKTMEPVVEEEFTPMIIREFIKDSRIKVVDRTEADIVLNGNVNSYKESPLSFDQNQEVLEYRITVTTHLKITRQKINNIIWEKDIIKSSEYKVSSNVMTTRTSKLLALKEIAKNLSEEVTDRVLWGW